MIKLVEEHHARFDGKGYPHGKTGQDIPLGARIIAVADSFDAMTSDRPYREALSIDQALQILRDGMDKQWDSQIVSTLIEIMQHQTADERTKTAISQQTGHSQASLQNSPP